MSRGDFSKKIAFLDKVEFSMIPGYTADDLKSVEIARSLWDAAINAGDTIPGGITLPSITINGVNVDWDPDQTKAVFQKNAAILRDDLADNVVPTPIDMGSNDALQFNDGEYFLLKGSTYDGELFLTKLAA